MTGAGFKLFTGLMVFQGPAATQPGFFYGLYLTGE
jgi:hypothetical protein